MQGLFVNVSGLELMVQPAAVKFSKVITLQINSLEVSLDELTTAFWVKCYRSSCRETNQNLFLQLFFIV